MTRLYNKESRSGGHLILAFAYCNGLFGPNVVSQNGLKSSGNHPEFFNFKPSCPLIASRTILSHN